MKKLWYVLMALTLGLMLTACGGNKNEVASEETYEDEYYDDEDYYEDYVEEDYYEDVEEIYEGMGGEDMDKLTAVIKVKNYGEIEIELLPEYAPITVANFQKLVSEEFYDGLTFHRIMKNFMIQGGDPEGNGTGGSGTNIKGEFISNGVDNTLSHKRGVVSMARSSFPNSASSQFFICDADDDFLDGQYAAFGRVTKGMDIVDKIADEISPLATDTNGSINEEDQPVIESITLK